MGVDHRHADILVDQQHFTTDFRSPLKTLESEAGLPSTGHRLPFIETKYRRDQGTRESSTINDRFRYLSFTKSR